MCFCDALKLRREIKEERQIPALPTICKNISVKTKLCTKINFYFIIWKAYLFPTTGNRFSTESQTRMVARSWHSYLVSRYKYVQKYLQKY